MKIIYKFVLVFALVCLNLQSLAAQSEAGRTAFGFNVGTTKLFSDEYFDNQWYIGGDVFMRYNVFKFLSLNASFGLQQIRWDTQYSNLKPRLDYPQYFTNPGAAGFYPFSGTEIQQLNSARVLTYDITASINLIPGEKFVPFIFGGVGMMNFEPKAGNTGRGDLPNNLFGAYEKTQISFPVGAGFELYITESFVLNGKATYRFTQTDYLDDIATDANNIPLQVANTFVNPTPGATAQQNDAFFVGSMGFSYYVFGDVDYDNDGLSNNEEDRIGTDKNNFDTDGDGLPDGYEVRGLRNLAEGLPETSFRTDPLKQDTDGDGLNDKAELVVHNTNPIAADTDIDGLKDGDEIAKGTKPTVPDTDGDGLLDGEEVLTYMTDPLNIDSDGDGLQDGEEVKKYSTKPNVADSDGDGLSDGDEVRTYKTNPNIDDTDADGLKDGQEVTIYKTDPLKADTDDDRASDSKEVLTMNTDPLNPDTDGDTVIDGLDNCPLIKGVTETSYNQPNLGCPMPPSPPPVPKVEKGTKTDFPDILFIVNTDEFNFDMPSTLDNLRKVLEYIKQCDNLQVVIEGHASEEGTVKRNQELSELRAKKVRMWLIDQGTKSEKVVSTIGYGSTKPKFEEPKVSKKKGGVNKEQLENVRKQNRRISVLVERGCDD